MSQETVSEQDGSIEAGRPRRWGFEQSPVNIRTDLLTHRRLPRLEFAYGNSAKIELEYVRHPADEPPGLGVHRPEENVAGHIRSHDHHLRVGDADYVLSEVHWHTPSEHLIDGRTFWAEHHLKHHRVDDPGDALVVAVFWEAGEDHPDLQRLVREFPRCRDNAEIITVDSVDLTRLVPTERASYRYRGSLTTAPYSEGVSWIVMASPLTARAATLAELETDFPGGTARSAHPLYRRTIETDVPRVR